jgi:ketosteroid isomerase-like protein
MSVFKASSPDTESVEVARRSYLAYVDKDRAAMERLIAEDFHFTSPLDNRLDRKTYFERCWPNCRWIAEFEFMGLVPDNGRVYVTYIGRPDAGRRFQNTEVLSIRGGKIVDAEVYFGWSLPHPAPLGGFLQNAPQT